MLKRLTAFAFLTAIAAVGVLHAESDLEYIQNTREYDHRIVTMIDGYLKDRSKIPADYQASSDKEFIRKIHAEKMGVKKADAAPVKPAASSAKSAPSKAPAKVAAKPAATPAPTPVKKKTSGREY